MRIEFGAYSLLPHPTHTILSGRVYEADILLGDVFTLLAWTPWLPEPVNGTRVGEPTVTHAVALRVEEIEAYQRRLEFLSSGMTGALRLTGPGLELLRAVDPSVRDGAWLLIGERHAEPGAAPDRRGM
jgi:hypothetical protein